MSTTNDPIRPEGEAVAPDTVIAKKATEAPETVAALFAAGKTAAGMYQAQRSTARSLLDHNLQQVERFLDQEPVGAGYRYKTVDRIRDAAAGQRAMAYSGATEALCKNAKPMVEALQSLKQCTNNELDAAARNEIDELLGSITTLKRVMYTKLRDDSQSRIMPDGLTQETRARDEYQSYCEILGDMAKFFKEVPN